MKKLYHAHALYVNGSTDEKVEVYINSAESKKEAREICKEYANEKRGVIRTWVK